MSADAILIDLPRAYDIEYVLQEDVCRYLFEIRYEERYKNLIEQGEDVEKLLAADREDLYQMFRGFLKDFSPDELLGYVGHVVESKIMRKVYVHETCVVCMGNPSTVILECGHKSLCRDCHEIITKTKGQCPICRCYFRISIFD